MGDNTLLLREIVLTWKAQHVVERVGGYLVMLPITTSLLRLSLVPLEIARAYCEAFASAAAVAQAGNRAPSDQSSNSGKAMSTQFYDTQVSTVDYEIFFNKRDKEALLDCGRVIVTGAMTGSGFESWRISLFIQKLNKESNPLVVTDGIQKPADWSDADAIELAAKVCPVAPAVVQRVIGLKPENLKYLQFEYQIISTFNRQPPRYDKDQVGVLREIATAIKNRH
jgi:hypothetical protein